MNINVLSLRYATESINEIFSETGRISAERDLWIAVLKTQLELLVEISEEGVRKIEEARDVIMGYSDAANDEPGSFL
jgi:adenylosuccinate lyase